MLVAGTREKVRVPAVRWVEPSPERLGGTVLSVCQLNSSDWETIVGTLKAGERVFFHYDGNDQKHAAAISYISSLAEYTPPVIYSRESRSKLVFMIEAIPDRPDSGTLNPGLPVDVFLETAS